MRIFDNVKFNKTRIVLNNELTEFPSNPEIGELSFVNGVLYIYSMISGQTTWFPLTNYAENYVHPQLTASTTWTINHNLESQNLAYFVYDDAGDYQIADVDFIDDNNIVLNLTEATTGRAVIFAATNAFASGSSTIVYVDKYAEKVNHHGDVSGSVEVSLDAGCVHTMNIVGATEINFSGWATGDRSSGVTLVMTNGGDHTITWPTSVKWPDGTLPILSISGVDRMVFISESAGDVIHGFVAGTNLS